MALVGLGSYLTYVCYNTVLFDRLMASTHFVGTAVFAMNLADSIGYTGSVAVQLGKDLLVGDSSRLEFLRQFSLFASLFGTISLISAWIYLSRFARTAPSPTEVTTIVEAPAEMTV
jgi:hypothetical protein